MSTFNFNKYLQKISDITRGTMISLFNGKASFDVYGSEYISNKLSNILCEQTSFEIGKCEINFDGISFDVNKKLLSSKFYFIHRIKINEEEFVKLIKLNTLLKELYNSINNFAKDKVVIKAFGKGDIDYDADDRLPENYRKIFETYKQSLYEILAEVLKILIEIINNNDIEKINKHKSNDELAKEANSINSIIKNELDRMKG